MQKTLKPFPVKVEPVIPLFLPYPAAAVIGPARIQRIIGVRMRLLLPIDSVGERTPGKGLPLAEAGREKIPSLSGPGPARKAPDFCEQPRSSFPEPFHHRGLLCLFPGQEAERGKQRLILRGFRIPQDRKGGVSFQQDGIGAALRQREGNVMDHGIVQHPAAQVPAHAVSFRFQAFSAGGLHASVQETGFKGLHFFNGILRRTGSDPVQQLIQVQIGHGCGNGGKLSFSDAGAPGEISSKLPEVQIMIGGEIAPVNPVPGSVVFIVLHESALTVKIPALFREGAVSVFVQPLHAAELFRDFRQRGIRVCRICFGGRPHVGRDVYDGGRLRAGGYPGGIGRLRAGGYLSRWGRPVSCRSPCSGRGKRGIPVSGFVLRRRILQYDDAAAFSVGTDRPVKEAEDHIRLCPVVKGNADPFFPFHPERGGQVGTVRFRKHLPSASDVTHLDFRSGIKIPLTHQERGPFPGVRSCENRKAGQIRPFMFFPDMIFFPGISRKLSQFQNVTPSSSVIKKITVRVSAILPFPRIPPRKKQHPISF